MCDACSSTSWNSQWVIATGKVVIHALNSSAINTRICPHKWKSTHVNT